MLCVSAFIYMYFLIFRNADIKAFTRAPTSSSARNCAGTVKKLCHYLSKNVVKCASEVEIDKLRELQKQERRRMSVLSERAMINNDIKSFKIFNNPI